MSDEKNAGTPDDKKTDDKKTDDKKTDDKKTDDEKTDDKKTDDERIDDKKTDDEKTDDRKTDDKKTDDEKTDDRKTDDRKTDDRKTDDRKTDERVARGKAASGRVVAPLRGDVATTRLPIVKEPEPSWLALDLPVVVAAVVLLAIGAVVHGVVARQRIVPFEKDGLVAGIPASYSLRTPLVATPGLPSETTFRKPGGLGRIVVRVDEKPAFLGSIESFRELQRGHALGEHYRQIESSRVRVGEREWLRTRFRYISRDAQPVEAVEYTFPADLAVNSPRMYVVQVHGSARQVARLEGLVLARLQVKVSP